MRGKTAAFKEVRLLLLDVLEQRTNWLHGREREYRASIQAESEGFMSRTTDFHKKIKKTHGVCPW